MFLGTVPQSPLHDHWAGRREVSHEPSRSCLWTEECWDYASCKYICDDRLVFSRVVFPIHLWLAMAALPTWPLESGRGALIGNCSSKLKFISSLNVMWPSLDVKAITLPYVRYVPECTVTSLSDAVVSAIHGLSKRGVLIFKTGGCRGAKPPYLDASRP